jgi:hypothetical protein
VQEQIDTLTVDVGGVTLGLCPVGSCTDLTVDGEPCEQCLALFDGSHGGWRLQPARPDVDVKAAAVVEVDPVLEQKVAAKLRKAELARPAPEGEQRANQTCWLCEERRTCTKQPQGWECPECQGLQ